MNKANKIVKMHRAQRNNTTPDTTAIVMNPSHNHNQMTNTNGTSTNGTSTSFNPEMPRHYGAQNQGPAGLVNNQLSNQNRFHGQNFDSGHIPNNVEVWDKRRIPYNHKVRGEIEFINEVRVLEEDNHSDIANNVAWEKMFDELKKYKETCGHMCVPHKFKIYTKLKRDKSTETQNCHLYDERLKGPEMIRGENYSQSHKSVKATQSSHSEASDASNDKKASTMIVTDVPKFSGSDRCQSSSCNDEQFDSSDSDDDNCSSIFSDDESSAYEAIHESEELQSSSFVDMKRSKSALF